MVLFGQDEVQCHGCYYYVHESILLVDSLCLPDSLVFEYLIWKTVLVLDFKPVLGW